MPPPNYSLPASDPVEGGFQLWHVFLSRGYYDETQLRIMHMLMFGRTKGHLASMRPSFSNRGATSSFCARFVIEETFQYGGVIDIFTLVDIDRQPIQLNQTSITPRNSG